MDLKNNCPAEVPTIDPTWWGRWRRVSGPWLPPGCRGRSHTRRWGRSPGSPASDTSLEAGSRVRHWLIYKRILSGSVKMRWNNAINTFKDTIIAVRQQTKGTFLAGCNSAFKCDKKTLYRIFHFVFAPLDQFNSYSFMVYLTALSIDEISAVSDKARERWRPEGCWMWSERRPVGCSRRSRRTGRWCCQSRRRGWWRRWSSGSDWCTEPLVSLQP